VSREKLQMSEPLISCIVPVYNGERYLREALDSILAQTYRPLEIIVADSSTTDGCRAIVSSYVDRMCYLAQEEAAPARARNLGLGAATGEFVAFLDHDDLWHPEKLARQMASFSDHPALDVCITHIQNFWVPEMREEEQRLRDHLRAQPVPGYIPDTLLARRSVFDKVGLFDESLWFADAMDWFLRAAEKDVSIEVLPDVLVYHRIHQTNISRRRAADSRSEFLMVVRGTLNQRRHQ